MTNIYDIYDAEADLLDQARISAINEYPFQFQAELDSLTDQVRLLDHITEEAQTEYFSWLYLKHQPTEFTQTAKFVDVRTNPALNAGMRLEGERTIPALNGWEVKTVIEKRDANGNFPAIQKAIDMGVLDENGNILPYKSCGSVGKSWDNHEIHSWKLE